MSEQILAVVQEHGVPVFNPTYKALIGQLFFHLEKQLSVRNGKAFQSSGNKKTFQ